MKPRSIEAQHKPSALSIAQPSVSAASPTTCSSSASQPAATRVEPTTDSKKRRISSPNPPPATRMRLLSETDTTPVPTQVSKASSKRQREHDTPTPPTETHLRRAVMASPPAIPSTSLSTVPSPFPPPSPPPSRRSSPASLNVSEASPSSHLAPQTEEDVHFLSHLLALRAQVGPSTKTLIRHAISGTTDDLDAYLHRC